jgi:hypothetical protein
VAKNEPQAIIIQLSSQSLTYEAIVFVPSLDGSKPKPIWDTINDPMKLITCACPQDGIFHDSGLFKLECALKRCEDCPKTLPLYPSEDYTWTSLGITDHEYAIWKFYNGRYSCIQHGQIGKKSCCQSCVATPIEKPDKKPQRKTHYCKARAPIGDFINGA